MRKSFIVAKQIPMNLIEIPQQIPDDPISIPNNHNPITPKRYRNWFVILIQSDASLRHKYGINSIYIYICFFQYTFVDIVPDPRHPVPAAKRRLPDMEKLENLEISASWKQIVMIRMKHRNPWDSTCWISLESLLLVYPIYGTDIWLWINTY